MKPTRIDIGDGDGNHKVMNRIELLFGCGAAWVDTTDT